MFVTKVRFLRISRRSRNLPFVERAHSSDLVVSAKPEARSRLTVGQQRESLSACRPFEAKQSESQDICATEFVDDSLPPLDGPLSFLPPEANFERLSSGRAGRAKIERSISAELPATFYFFHGELVAAKQNGTMCLQLTGCEFRRAESGPRAGRYVVPLEGTERTVVVSPEDIQLFEHAETSSRLRELRRLRRINRAHLRKV